MDRKRYLAIYQELDLKHDPAALPIYLLQNSVLAGCIVTLTRFQNTTLKFAAIPLLLTLIYRCFSLMHEAVHGLVAKNQLINDFFGAVAGGFCLLSYESWKQAHLEHHQWGGNIDKDPVMAMVKTYPSLPASLKKILNFGWQAWIPILSTLQHTVFWNLTAKHFLKGTRSRSDIMSIVIPILIWSAVLWLVQANILSTVIAPSLFLYLIFTEVVNAPHHLGLPQYRGETKLPLWEQFRIARSCIYPRWLARFVVLNFNYHTEHHMYPNVPWYHLDKLHGVIKNELQGEYNTDPQFAWVLKNRKKNLGELFIVTTPASEIAKAA